MKFKEYKGLDLAQTAAEARANLIADVAARHRPARVIGTAKPQN